MLDIFDLIHPTFKFDKTKPIRLFEAFAGVGTQAMALKRLGINFENVGISDTQLYKQAGNAIVVDVLMAIFKELF